MSNLTYNPNVNVSYHDSFDQPRNDYSNMRNDYNSSSMRNDYSNMRNNFRNDNDNSWNNRNNFENNYYENNDMPRNFQSIDSRSEYSRPINKSKKPKKIINENYENETEKTTNSKFDWTLIIKKLVIFTALFLIMSSVKMDELVCKFVPYLSGNQLICMTTKGIILSILIIIINLLL